MIEESRRGMMSELSGGSSITPSTVSRFLVARAAAALADPAGGCQCRCLGGASQCLCRDTGNGMASFFFSSARPLPRWPWRLCGASLGYRSQCSSCQICPSVASSMLGMVATAAKYGAGALEARLGGPMAGSEPMKVGYAPRGCWR